MIFLIFFIRFQVWAHCCRLAMFFMRSIKKYWQILPRTRAAHTRQRFHFQKITETLQNFLYFVENLQISYFYFKEQLP